MPKDHKKFTVKPDNINEKTCHKNDIFRSGQNISKRVKKHNK